MGFLDKTENIEVITKLTNYGKSKILTEGLDLIHSFRIGDSDANYLVDGDLSIGEIPNFSGSKTNVDNSIKIENPIYVSNNTSTIKYF